MMMDKKLTMGVDIGSTASKAVIMENGTSMIASCVIPVGTGTRGPGEVYRKVLEQASVSREQIDYIVATGYGRLKFEEADRELSEVSCHGKGASWLVPGARTVIDIGGQDAKGLSLDGQGNLMEFLMNDKCAAGTGRFLEAMARVLDVKVEEMGNLSLKSQNPASISSTCTVFAESEVISRLAEGERIEDILAGIHTSIAKRVIGLVTRIGISSPIVMTGGVAHNIGVVAAMKREMKKEIIVPDQCQLAGAIGAAIFAAQFASRAAA